MIFIVHPERLRISNPTSLYKFQFCIMHFDFTLLFHYKIINLPSQQIISDMRNIAACVASAQRRRETVNYKVQDWEGCARKQRRSTL